MNYAQTNVCQLRGDEAVKEFQAFKLLCFNGPGVVASFNIASTRFAVMQPNGSEKVKMALITERRNLWNWLPDFQSLALTANQLLSMHTTA